MGRIKNNPLRHCEDGNPWQSR